MISGIVSVYARLILIMMLVAMAGCSNDTRAVRGPAAGRAESNAHVLEPYGLAELDVLRVAQDAARNRLWVLTLDDVRVYDTASKWLVRSIVLPNWSVTHLICKPAMVLDRSGSAIVSSNGQARLWRINADSFELTQHDIRMHEREQWDIGFGALALAADGTLLALTAAGGSLWSIDIGKGSAHIFAPDALFLNVCDLTTQFLDEYERSRKPWTRPSMHPNSKAR